MDKKTLDKIRKRPEFIEHPVFGELWFGPASKMIAKMKHGWDASAERTGEEDVVELVWLSTLIFTPDRSLVDFLLEFSYGDITELFVPVYKDILTKQVQVEVETKKEEAVVA